tara:strand:- start:13924 stop:14649 length:726 start_codon:yes stop_codon:yes gene_type:complete
MGWSSSTLDPDQFKLDNKNVNTILKSAGIQNPNTYTRRKGGKDGIVLTNRNSIIKITANNPGRPGSINEELKFMSIAGRLNIAPKLHVGKIINFENKKYLVMKSEKMNGNIRNIRLTRNNYEKIKHLVSSLHNKARITHNNLHPGQVVYKIKPNGSKDFRLINFGRSSKWNRKNYGSLSKNMNGLFKMERSIVQQKQNDPRFVSQMSPLSSSMKPKWAYPTSNSSGTPGTPRTPPMRLFSN